MKLKKIAFLFFCALLLAQNSLSQQTIDSINYHVKLYNKAKNTDDLILAYNFFRKNKDNYLKEKYYIGVVFNSLHLSSVQGKLGQYYDSETSATEGIKLLNDMSENTTTLHYRKFLLNRLGNLYITYKDYKTSTIHYLNVLKLATNNRDSAIAYNNIGITYKLNNQFGKAKKYFNKAHNLVKETNDKEKIAMTLSNLGYAKVRLNEENGILDIIRALEIKMNEKVPTVYETYKDLTEYYKYKNDSVKALTYANKGYLEAKKNNIIPYIEDALSNLIDLKSYEYIDEYKRISDSLKTNRLLADNKYSLKKYNYSTAQNKQKEAELNEAEAKAENLLFLSGIIIVVLSSTFIFYYLKNRHKKDNLKTRFDAERQISKKLHDEVANSVFHTMSKQQNKSIIDVELIDDLEEIYLKTRDISKTSAALKITENFDEDLKDLVLSYKTDTVNIFTRNMSEMPWYTLSHLKKETVYRVLQELMINMTKHSNASMVTLQFQKESRKIAIQYTDNGVGAALKKSNGLQNMENRIKDIGGTVIFESETNKGFQVKMTV